MISLANLLLINAAVVWILARQLRTAVGCGPGRALTLLLWITLFAVRGLLAFAAHATGHRTHRELT